MKQLPLENTKLIIHTSTTIAVWAIVVLFLFCSCELDNNKQLAQTIEERDSLPSIVTTGVSTLISDSGRISYKIEAEEWKIFDKRNPPFWAFEKGAYLEKYDDSMNIKAIIVADTVYYFDDTKIWKLIGNVNVVNQEEEKFRTQLMFWNQKTEKVYSDSFIEIEKGDRLFTGIGFVSNQQFTEYEIKNTGAIIPVDKEKTLKVENDSL